MANSEHLAILGEGVVAWNEWRARNSGIRPDLSGANLTERSLVSINFSDTNLCNANFAEAQLSKSNLMYTNLSNAILTGAWLECVGFGGANLTGADLRKARLLDADLFGATLTGVNAPEADLMHANLARAKLGQANLYRADLRYCIMVGTSLARANLTGSRLYGTARDDWIIENVECKYVFLDADGKNRLPKDRDFAPGEFEQLYQALPTIEYVFQNGMTPIDPLIMERVVEDIQEQNPEYDIQIDSISARGQVPSIKFTVRLEGYKEAARTQVQDLYGGKLRQVEAERDQYWAAIVRALDAPREIKLIAAAPGSIVATDGSTINITQHIHHAVELQKLIAELPEDNETLSKTAKRKAMDVIGGAIQDFAKGKVREAAAVIIDICKDLGPVIVNTAAYEFFKSYLGL